MKIRHLAIVARDSQILVDFYVALGCEVLSHVVEEGRFVSHLVGIPSSSLLVTKLKFPNGTGQLEIIEYIRPRGPEKKPNNANDFGLSHIALTVESLEQSLSRLLSGGGKLVSSPLHSPDGKVAVCYARDPEGNILELVEEIDRE